MAYSSEIEKLRARYNENPKGRNFAPLADAYRKAKQLDEAIALCREGLTHHPDYVSAHIVLGRCLADKADDAGAEGAFRRVLELDSENIIALKLLADIAVRSGRPGEAVSWLTRLLQVDPMNGEAAELLAAARGKLGEEEPAPLPATLTEMPAAQPPGVSPDDPTKPMTAHDAPALPEPDKAEAVEEGLALEVEGETEEAAASAAGAELGGEIESYDSIDFSSVAGGGPVAGAAREEFDQAPDDAIPVPGLARSQYEGSGLFKLDAPGAGDAGASDAASPADAPEPAAAESEDAGSDTEPADLPLILPEEITPAPAAAARRGPAPDRPREAAERKVQPLLAFPDDEGAADQAALSASPPLVTETMAELYLRQGHLDDAARVYRALLEQRPDDAELKAKLESLARPRAGGDREGGRSEGARPTAVEFLQSVFSGDRAAPPVGVQSAAGDGEPGATVLDQAFAEPAAEGAPPATGAAEPAPDAVRGAPTRPAEDALSLDRVFDEGQEGGPSAPEVEKGAAVGARASFSFDDFFQGAEPPQAPAGQPSATAPSPGRAPRVSEADQDLDQFQAWLRSLKS